TAPPTAPVAAVPLVLPQLCALDTPLVQVRSSTLRAHRCIRLRVVPQVRVACYPWPQLHVQFLKANDVLHVVLAHLIPPRRVPSQALTQQGDPRELPVAHLLLGAQVACEVLQRVRRERSYASYL